MDETFGRLPRWTTALLAEGIIERQIALAIDVRGKSLNRVPRHRRWGRRTTVRPTWLRQHEELLPLDKDGLLALLESQSSRAR